MTTGIASALGLQPAPHSSFHWWQGASGEWWITSVYPLGITFHAMPAVYVMVRRQPNGQRDPIYIGETENCTERMKQHAQGGKMIQAALLEQMSSTYTSLPSATTSGSPLKLIFGGVTGRR